MKYIKEINDAYAFLGMVPLNGQDKLINEILVEFLDNNKKHVALAAATGIGKSIIAAVVSLCIKELCKDNVGLSEDTLPSMIVVHSNNLVRQYTATFKKYDPRDFHQIIGAGNYKCEAGNALSVLPDPEYTGADCFKKQIDRASELKYCMQCEYDEAKSYINATNTLITNYTYHFISSLFTHHLANRKLVIFDEAHTLNDVFCEHNTIYISADRLTKYMDECKQYFPTESYGDHKILKKIKYMILDGEVTDSNYKSVIEDLLKCYRSIGALFEKELKETIDNDEYIKLKKVGKKYNDLCCKISDLLIHKYDHVFEAKNSEVTIKPIFINNMSDYITSDFNLYMSATISDKFIIDTLSLNPDEVSFINPDPVYDPDHKPILFLGKSKLNYNLMSKLTGSNQHNITESEKLEINYLKEVIYEISTDAVENDLKGLMLTPSFKVGEVLSDNINQNMKIFLHTSGGRHINDLIKDFKDFKGPAILISPSIYEGLDFADNLSRFQIIVKCPFASLGEKRMSYIATNYPDIYKIMALKKIVQGIGRSIRNKDDYATTFVLDKNIEFLFNSKLNVWKNEFTVL